MANKINVKALKEMSVQKAFRQLAKSCENSCSLHYSSIDAKYKTVAEIRVVLSVANKEDSYKQSLEKIIQKSGVEIGKNFELSLLKALHAKNDEEEAKKFEKYLYSLLRVIKKLDELEVKLSDSYKYLKKHGLDVLSNNRNKQKENNLIKSNKENDDENVRETRSERSNGDKGGVAEQRARIFQATKKESSADIKEHQKNIKHNGLSYSDNGRDDARYNKNREDIQSEQDNENLATKGDNNTVKEITKNIKSNRPSYRGDGSDIVRAEKNKRKIQSEQDDENVKFIFERAIKDILSCYDGCKYKKLKKGLLTIAKRLDTDEALGLGAVVKNCVKEFKNAKK